MKLNILFDGFDGKKCAVCGDDATKYVIEQHADGRTLQKYFCVAHGFLNIRTWTIPEITPIIQPAASPFDNYAHIDFEIEPMSDKSSFILDEAKELPDNFWDTFPLLRESRGYTVSDEEE